ncbi:MAG: type II toxin-antitoxin system VapC family toxin [Roseimicrobium sp.]
MFVVLDTNHYREFARASVLGARLNERLASEHADAFTTIVTVQEVSQGWLAEINSRKTGRDQLHAYQQFQEAVDGFSNLTILPFDNDAAEAFHRLQGMKLRGGTMDQKIAAIAISHDALLLSRNLVDFQDIPGLRVENWLD